MYRESNSDPLRIPAYSYNCKHCHSLGVDFTYLWLTNFKTTRRGDRYGAMEHHAYSCDKCGALLILGYWRRARQPSFDDYLQSRKDSEQ